MKLGRGQIDGTEGCLLVIRDAVERSVEVIEPKDVLTRAIGVRDELTLALLRMSLACPEAGWVVDGLMLVHTKLIARLRSPVLAETDVIHLTCMRGIVGCPWCRLKMTGGSLGVSRERYRL